MPRKIKRSKAEVLAAIPGSGGIVSKIAKRLGIGRRTLFEYRQRWPEVEEAITDATEAGLDFAETQLMNLIESGDIKAIMYYLDNKGRGRGWGAQQQIQVQGPPVQPIICFADGGPEKDGTDGGGKS